MKLRPIIAIPVLVIGFSIGLLGARYFTLFAYALPTDPVNQFLEFGPSQIRVAAVILSVEKTTHTIVLDVQSPYGGTERFVLKAIYDEATLPDSSNVTTGSRIFALIARRIPGPLHVIGISVLQF